MQENAGREVAAAKRNLLNLLPSESEELLRAFAVEHGEKPFRGSQVARHLWQSPVDSFAAMSDVPGNRIDPITSQASPCRLGAVRLSLHQWITAIGSS